MEYISLKERFFKTNEEIEKIYYIINKFQDKIKDKEIIKEIENFGDIFKNYYNPYIGLKRFLIPIFGKISSGKSTLLNYLLNLHGIFETDTKTCTKFICIVRHNPKLTNELKLFNVSISERGEYKSRKLWNFEKGDEISGDIKKIIARRNKEIGKLEIRHSNWEKYFILMEANIPLFQGFNNVYSELFEFMDIPGLNEFTGIEEIEAQFYYKELIPFFIYNVGFSLYIYDLGNQEIEDKKNSIINNIMNLYFDNDPCKQKNSIFILNKVDLISEPENGLEKLKNILAESLECRIDQKGFFIGLSGLNLYRKRFKYYSFYDYLLYILNELKGNEELNFEEYIIKNLSKDFNDDKIEENLDILDEGEIPEEDKKLLDKINDEATKKHVQNLSYGNYKYYKEIFQKYPKDKKEDLGVQHKNFESLLIKSFNNVLEEFCENFTHKDLKKKLLKELVLTDEDLKIKKLDIKKDPNIKIDDPFVLLKSIKDIIESIVKLAEKHQKKEIDTNERKVLNESNEKEDSDELLKEFEIIENSTENKESDKLTEIKEFEESEKPTETKEPEKCEKPTETKESIDTNKPNDDGVSFIKEMLNEYQEAMTDMKQRKIRIPLLGEYSSGKSSLLNTIIGHDYNVLPVSVEVCTNIALVIKYTQKEKDIALYHTFLEKNPRNFYIFNTEKKPLANGVKTIKSVLNLLNILYSSLKYNESFQNQGHCRFPFI